MVEVRQEDRDAAAALFAAWFGADPSDGQLQFMLAGRADDTKSVQAFAAHREAADRAIVEWLLSEEADWPEVAGDIADAIAAGQHRKETAGE